MCKSYTQLEYTYATSHMEILKQYYLKLHSNYEEEILPKQKLTACFVLNKIWEKY